MDLSPFVRELHQHLATAAEAGGDDALAMADRLAGALDVATRLVLLEALAQAAEEISLELSPGTVEVRLRGRDPEFVVSSPEMSTPAPPALTSTAHAPGDDDGGTTRLNLRLPESLKQVIEDAANAEGLSLNAWLVRAATTALTGAGATRPATSTGGQRLTGWAR